MKKTVLLFAFVFAAISMNAQSVDDILNNYFENTGGIDTWKKMSSMKMIGKVPSPQGDFNFVLYSKRPDKMKIEVDIQGTIMIPQCYDGKTAWSVNPFAGGNTATKLTDEETNEMAKESVFESEYIDYQNKGHEIALEGKETIEGTECYKLKVTKYKGNETDETVEYHFFDAENYVPIMIRTTIKTGPAKGRASEEFLSDYQETDSGLMFPYYFETKMEGEVVNKIVVETIEFNAAIEDSIFEMPAEE